MMPKRLFLFLMCLPAALAAQTPLQRSLDRLLEDDFYQTATVGISVYDLTDDQLLYTRNDRRLCRPASNTKLLTAAAAVHYLGASYEFRTWLLRTGTIDADSCLHGDLYLAGGFDPEFTSGNLDTLVQLLKLSGVRRFAGNVYADASAADEMPWGKGWSWDDDMEAFQPYLSPVPVNKGVVKLKISPMEVGTRPVIQTNPGTAYVEIDNRATTIAKTDEPPAKSLRFRRTFNGVGNVITVSGSIAANARPYEISISIQSPNSYVLTLFAEKLAEQLPGSLPVCGGTAIPPVPPDTVGYTAHRMPDVILRMNKESDNLNAEMLLYAIGLQCCGKPSSTEKGIGQVREMIRQQLKLKPENYSIVDGSGLSHQNYLTPELITTLLHYMYHTPDFRLFRASLPEAGIDGTLKNRLKKKSVYRKVFAKTGSLTGVSTLSGYMEADNGHLLAFSIMIQNFVEKTSPVAIRYIDGICEQVMRDL
ncbi:MAG: D-alanyl-D-alanine carboxypeptidase/D-alanyl-D-alanine-endopeptidase [Bacteroidales bacterium]|nr:D-alanyl-D-alanine carboxypeptidase/D-alanyl-D-alanine-endopeptidase [Bacteroidales bacterium]